MRSVNLSTLKSQLSAHIQLVRGGEEILIRDRERPIARITPFVAENHTEHRQKMIAEGRLSPAKRNRSVKPWPKPPGRGISREVAERLWNEEREGR